MFKKVFYNLFSPFRYAVRYELERQATQSMDINKTMLRLANEDAADYVAKNMINAISVDSTNVLLSTAFNRADLDAKKLICEFGVFSGNSINHIASLTEHKVYGFDSFDGLPERWREGYGKGHFNVTSLPKVRANVVLIKGWFDKTLPEFIKEHDGSVGFLHLDADLYSSTKTVFNLLGSRIGKGCIIVFDEYFNYPGWKEGEYKAFQEFISDSGLGYEYIGYNRVREQVAVLIK